MECEAGKYKEKNIYAINEEVEYSEILLLVLLCLISVCEANKKNALYYTTDGVGFFVFVNERECVCM